jgi:hypothetical protein
MGVGTELEPRVRRVGVGIVEIVPDEHVEDRSLRNIKDNLRNRVCALLVAIIVAAQVADVVTTYRALSGHWYVENNPVLRALIVRSPLAAYTVKLLTIGAMVVVVLSRLRGRRACIALAIAAGISLTAPLLNVALILS